MTTETAGLSAEAIRKYAEVIVRVGLNLQPGQPMIVSARAEDLPLVRAVAEAAYRAGGGLVTPLLSDDALTLARYELAAEDTLDQSAGWLFDGMARGFDDGAARLAIKSDDPALLAKADPTRLARAMKATAIASKPAMERVTGMVTNWCVVGWPGRAWAARVFPDLAPDTALARLGQAILTTARATGDDPVADWAAHNAELRARGQRLNDARFHALHFRGPGTDLTVGLADDHAWRGGAARTRGGTVFNPNLPTEEVFTTPHKDRVEGHVRATKPLAHQGSLIEEIEVRFEGGKITEARAATGEAAFLNLLDTDPGARRLGEVALVPHGSPISASELLFLNTLYDENAASHIALGQCYKGCFQDPSLSDDAMAAQGGNASIIHVDWMIGSGDIDVDGLDADGARTPLMRAGEWAD